MTYQLLEMDRASNRRMSRTVSFDNTGHDVSCYQRWMFRFLKWLMRLVLRTFFRSILIVGRENFPKSGPTIVVANHSNQFVDGMMLQVNCGHRRISFLIAEKSMHRPVIGQVAKISGAVPVIRRQDIAFTGQGQIVLFAPHPSNPDQTIVTGVNTAFTEEIQPGFQLRLARPQSPTLSIASITSDTELIVTATSLENPPAQGAQYRVFPKVDHSTMFAHVFETLARGGCVGIFPEGTSTDKTQMLEFQAGVAIIALGARARGINVRIQPVGLNYFHAHRWRSQAAIRFANPFHVPESIAQLNNTDKKEASRQLLKLIRDNLEAVTFQVPSYEAARVVHVARSLYVGDKKIKTEEAVELSRRFAVAYTKLSAREDVKGLLHEVEQYAETLATYHISDKDVGTVRLPWLRTFALLIGHFLRVLAFFPIVLLSSILVLPVVTLANIKARSEMVRAKSNAPTTKNRGLDVVASKKVVVGITTMPWLLVLYVVIAIVTTEFLVSRSSTVGRVVRAITPVAVVFGLPLLMYAGLRASDVFWLSVSNLRPLVLGLCNPTLADKLVAIREELTKRVRAKVEELLPEFEFGDRVLPLELDPSKMDGPFDTYTE